MLQHVIGKGFNLFKEISKPETLKIFSQTVGDTVFTVVKNKNDDIVLQRAKTIERWLGGVKITKKVTSVDNRANLRCKEPVKYMDSMYSKERVFAQGTVDEAWHIGRQPLDLNPKDLAHSSDFVRTGHLKRYSDGSLLGVPNGFEYVG